MTGVRSYSGISSGALFADTSGAQIACPVPVGTTPLGMTQLTARRSASSSLTLSGRSIARGVTREDASPHDVFPGRILGGRPFELLIVDAILGII